MTKTELSEHYANQKVLANPRNAFTGYSWDTQKKLNTFDGYDIEQAYEDGFDKAVEVACELIERLHLEIAGYPVCLPDQFVEDFKANMEEGV